MARRRHRCPGRRHVRDGDLIIGKDGKSAVGTLVERATRYVMLLHLPGEHGAENVRTRWSPRSNLSVHSPEHLASVAAELKGSPRKTLGWETPAERLHKLLAA